MPKNVVFAILIAIYIILPWVRVNGAPVMWIDIPHRAAYLSGRTITNQDFYPLFFLVSGMGFALFDSYPPGGTIGGAWEMPVHGYRETSGDRFGESDAGDRQGDPPFSPSISHPAGRPNSPFSAGEDLGGEVV